jgi:hypothetical protein
MSSWNYRFWRTMDGSGVASGADRILISINTLAAFCCQQYVGL